MADDGSCCDLACQRSHTGGTGYVVNLDHGTPVPKSYKITDEIVDPFCDAQNPKAISFEDVTAAAFLIKGGVARTPCTKSTNSDRYGMDLYFKKDFLQHTGSFKERGARTSLLKLSDEQKKKGVVAASAGNHAQGMSYHGMLLGIPVTVVMPTIAPIMKIQKCRVNYKANVVVEGKDMAEAKAIALKMAKDKGMLYVNGYDHENILAGQGTCGLEICEEVEKPDAVLVPIGGGGLIAGIAVAVKGMSPGTMVIGCESEKSCGFANSVKHGEPTYTATSASLADGLAVPVVGYNSYYTARPLLDKLVVLKEEWIALAILRLVEEEKAICEGAGAIGMAAILSGMLPELKGKKVVVVLSGGNIDTTVLGRVLERGLASEGRLVKFYIEISDRPGGIQELCTLLLDLGVSIKDIMHERAWLRDIYVVEIKVICETRDWVHSKELKAALKAKYQRCAFSEQPLAVQDANK